MPVLMNLKMGYDISDKIKPIMVVWFAPVDRFTGQAFSDCFLAWYPGSESYRIVSLIIK